MAQLTQAQAAFLQNPYIAVVTTLRPDGSPHSTPVWVDCADGQVSFNTARGRAKERHILADPRVSLTVVDPGEPYRWLSITGTAELVDEGADAQIDALAKKYLGADKYPFRREGERRVTVRIAPQKIDSLGLDG